MRRSVIDNSVERVWHGVYLPKNTLPLSDDSRTSQNIARTERYRDTVIGAARHGTDARTVSHISAGAVHRVPMLWPDLSKVHFTSTTTGRRTARGMVHRAVLLPSDIVVVDGIRVTSLARTVCDIARLGDHRQAVCVLDSGLKLGVAIEEIATQVARLGRHHGIAMLRAAVPLADGRSESVGESLSRVSLADCPEIPAPDLQVNVTIEMNGSPKDVRCDFGWRDDDGVLRVVGEFDGRLKYHRSNPFGNRLPEDVIYDEKLREDGIRASGKGVVRWTWDEAVYPERLHPKVIVALRASGIIP